jgi:sugar phosphate isomerase/epimerase
MVHLSINSVLFRAFDFPTAVRHIALAGYDGLEIAAIKGMCEHLDLSRWQTQLTPYQELMEAHGLRWYAMEVGSPDPDRVKMALEAAAAFGIPTITIGPGGRSDDPDEWPRMVERMQTLRDLAEAFAVNLAVKAHIGQSMYNTPTTQQVLAATPSDRFGVDLDPSHLFRSGEDPAEAARAVLARIHHVHIRDCPADSTGPGPIWQQTSGRGAIDLFHFCRALVHGGYHGPLTLEVIGAKDESLTELGMLAAENRGYLNAVLRQLERE